MTTVVTSLLLLDQAITALTGNTNAAANVFSDRTWPTWDGNYPCILGQVLSDIKQGQGKNSIGFTAITTLRIICRASAEAGDNDLGSTTAAADAWEIARQVEMAIVNAPPFYGLVQEWLSINSTPRISSDGDTSIADVYVDIGIGYYVDASAFYVETDPTLTEQTIATNQSDLTNDTRLSPGADITNT